MPESSRLSSETRQGTIKIWESTLSSTMPAWFERTETPRVFRLKGSAGSASPVA